MARVARKQLADARALEEEAERFNPLVGSGATPSMGLSQYRGGGLFDSLLGLFGLGHEECSRHMRGGGFLSGLLPGPLGGIASMFGLGRETHPNEIARHIAHHLSRHADELHSVGGSLRGGFFGNLLKMFGLGKSGKDDYHRIKQHLEGCANSDLHGGGIFDMIKGLFGLGHDATDEDVAHHFHHHMTNHMNHLQGAGLFDMFKGLFGFGEGDADHMEGAGWMDWVKKGADLAGKAGKLAYENRDAIKSGLSHLGTPGQQLAKGMTAVGLGKRGKRGKLHGGFWGLALRALPTLLGLGHDTHPEVVGQHLARQLHGSGFFDDFAKGFSQGFSGVMNLARPILGFGHKKHLRGGFFGNLLKLFGLGKDTHPYVVGQHLHQHLKGAGLFDSLFKGFTSILGMGHSGGAMYGYDPLTSRGNPTPKRVAKALAPVVAPALAKAVVSSKYGYGTGAGDGRKKRAEIVKRVMAEKGLSMIEASKYVKAHGLY